MGFWDFINSIIEAVKHLFFDPTAVALGKIHDAVRGQIGLFALKFFKNAALNLIPGTKVVTEITAETMNEVKSNNRDQGNERSSSKRQQSDL